MSMAQLEDLLGGHKLSGVDFSQDKDAAAMHFVLDGKTYSAVEDPDDGYRSMLGTLIESQLPVKNKFPACNVVGTWKADGDELVVLLDCKTGKPVLEVGTDYSDDYYPCFIANFVPENMAINQKTSKKKATTIKPQPLPGPKNAAKLLGTTRDKLAETMQKRYAVFITEAGDWRPVADYVLNLVEMAMALVLVENTENKGNYILDSRRPKVNSLVF